MLEKMLARLDHYHNTRIFWCPSRIRAFMLASAGVAKFARENTQEKSSHM